MKGPKEKTMSDRTSVAVEQVSKKLCRSLRRSMFYGIQDIARETLGLSSGNDCLRDDEFWAIDNISFTLSPGDCLGIIGANGAGKSTLLKMINGIIWPDRGHIRLKGRVGSLIEVGAGFHPQLSGRENIYINGAILGLSRHEITKCFEKIVDFAELSDFIDSPVKQYSSGMYVRLGFSIAIHAFPDILLLDEILAVGDEAFRRKCIDRMEKYIKQGGIIVLVTHDLNIVRRFCSTAIWLNEGQIKKDGNATFVSDCYQSNALEKLYHTKSVAKRLIQDKKNAPQIKEISLSKERYETGDNIEIVINYIPAGYKKLGIGIVIRDVRGEIITICNTTRDSISVPTESTQVLLYLPDNDLTDGFYSLDISLTDEKVLYGYETWEKAVTFHIKTPINSAGLQISEGKFRAKHTWKFTAPQEK